MPDRTHTSRRDFLKTAAIAAAPIILTRIARANQDTPAAPPFAPPLGICRSPKHAKIIKAAGADYVEAGVRGDLMPTKPEADFRARIKPARDCGLPIRAANGFLPGSLKCVGPKANQAGVLEFADTAFKRAHEAGIQFIVFGSSGARGIPDGFDRRRAELQFAALLGRMAPLAGKHDVIVVIEPLRHQECNFINTLADGAAFIEAVNHPHLRLLADIYHMTQNGETPADIRKYGHLLHHAHIAENRKRTAPGVDGDDFTGFLQALKDVGYIGGISCECRWDDVEKQLPVALKSLRKQLAAVK